MMKSKNDASSEAGETPGAKAISPPLAVPVFNCVVYLSPPDATGRVVARVANLPEVIGGGGSEREALQQVVTAFKQVAARYLAAGGAPPFIAPPALAVGEQQRLIAVHL